MDRSNNLIKVFVGPEESAILLKSLLEDIGIVERLWDDDLTTFGRDAF